LHTDPIFTIFTIPERRGGDDALLRLVDLEVAVGTGEVAAVFQFLATVFSFD